MIIQNYVKQVIEGYAGLPSQIKYYTKFNQPVKIIDDTLTEVIGAVVNNTLCGGGTGGGGWDAVDGGERRTLPMFNLSSMECGKKVSFFAEHCSHCESTSFKIQSVKNVKHTNPKTDVEHRCLIFSTKKN